MNFSENYASRSTVRPPHGRDAIYEFAEWDPVMHLRQDGTPYPAWEAAWIKAIGIPLPLLYLDVNNVTRISVHRKVGPQLLDALSEIKRAGLWDYLSPYGGGYSFRLKRGSNNLSMHALGLAVDFDPENNALGMAREHTRFGTNGGQAVVRIFSLYGWSWGGAWERPDAMHFQFGTGY